MASQRTLGLLFIGIGGALLIVLTTDVDGEIFVGFLGLGFLGAYAATRSYWLLIPGGILTGLGTGLIIESQGGPSGSVVLGLGCGFLAIATIDRLVSSADRVWWWPLIPGAVLVTVGASNLTGIPNLGRYLVPAGLILIGVLLLLRKPGAGEHDRDDGPTLRGTPDRQGEV
jgi:hypothetical protein